MPQLQLDYFLPQEVYGDDAFTPEIEPPVPFSLGIRVSNSGSGTAYHLAIESAQPKIVENEQGLLIDFVITGSEVNGVDATPSLLVNFGDIAPDSAGVARWVMACSLSGEFTEFSAEISHADELGGNLTALIKEDDVRTHLLIHDILVDLPGRDSIRDFLITDNPTYPFQEGNIKYHVYESENTDSSVIDLSGVATLTQVDGAANTYTLSFNATTLSSLNYVTLPDPTNGQQILQEVIRSDGKKLNPANAWLSRTRDEQQTWEFFVHLFDSMTTPRDSWSYTLIFTNPLHTLQPPVIQFLPDRSGLEGEPLFFLVEASCSGHTDVCMPELSAVPLPAGATFSDQGDGTAIFDWIPVVGQAGGYTLTVQASDGDLAATQEVRLTIWTDQPPPTPNPITPIPEPGTFFLFGLGLLGLLGLKGRIWRKK
jgi:hypothetical protein